MPAARVTKLIALAACFLAGIATAYEPQTAYSNAPQSAAPAAAYAPPATPVGSIVPVLATRHRPTISLGGTVVPNKEVTLSAQLPGRVAMIAGEEGDSFNEGTILAQLDDSELLAQRQAAWAVLMDADAQLRNADVQYNRELIAPSSRSPSSMPGMGLPSLFDQFVSRPLGQAMGQGNPGLERYTDLYSRQTQLEQARNAISRAQSQLQQLDAKIRDAKSVAPFNGVIAKKLVEVGDTVQPGQPILKYADTEALQIEIDVPSRVMQGIRKDMDLTAKLDFNNIIISVHVAQIFPIADAARHTVKVKLDIPREVPASPGMYVQVMVPDVSSPVQSVIVIPRSAVIERGSLPMVHVAIGKDQKELRSIRLGEMLDAEHVVVLSGLRQGEYVHVPENYYRPPPAPVQQYQQPAANPWAPASPVYTAPPPGY